MKLLQSPNITNRNIRLWLGRLLRCVISAPFLALVGSAIGVIAVNLLQEPVAVEIQPQDNELPLEGVLGLSHEEFSEFPRHWRQVFATVALEPSNYHPMTVRILSSISPESAELIRNVASHVVEDKYIVRDNALSTRHTFVTQSLFSRFLDLETLGFLQTADTGLEVTMSNENPEGERYIKTISTSNHRMLALKKDKQAKIMLPVTTLTEAGQEIVSLLREPISFKYIKWVANLIQEQGFDVTVWSSWSDATNKNGFITTQLEYPVYIDERLAEFELLPKYLIDGHRETEMR